jgi:hypothetical protein
MAPAGSLKQAIDQFSDYRWRLTNLYYITGKAGKRVKFEPNWAQEAFLSEMWAMNVILKARQLGFTTLIQLFMLDQIVFNSNKRAGTIAHNLKDAGGIFRDKIKFPFDNLPEGIRNTRKLVMNSATELALSNNSSIRVGTSMRSGTLNFLHISELGKIAAKYPEKAREIRTGALNAVEAGQWVSIESTAEGQEGDFYDICQSAQTIERIGSKLTVLDFKFHFYPWWQAPEYRLDPDGVLITAEHIRYFEDLELKHRIHLDPSQKAWYVKKAASQLDDMKREYPSTPEEAFAASVEGAYYGTLMAKAEASGRVGHFPAIEGVPVHTAWDLGYSDYTTIWFFQILGREVRLVGYFQDCGEGAEYYAKKVIELRTENGWTATGAKDWVPHDARVTEWGSKKTRVEQLVENGLKPDIPTAMGLHDGINAVRAILPQCTFDEANCSEGLACLKQYRKSWNDTLGHWSDTPFHNVHSHGADGFRILACAHRDIKPVEPPAPPPKVEVKPLTFDNAIANAARNERVRRNHMSRI